MVIKKKDIKLLNQAGHDRTGYLFMYKNRLFRAIDNSSIHQIKTLFDCGLIDKLIKAKLFVNSRITDYSTEDSKLVIEHDLITPIIYPHEWSFDMLKDSAIVTLKVNLIAKNYGFQTIDAHAGNILFHNNSPVFVDLGSFIPLENKTSSWFALEEFNRAFFYPLTLWSKGFYTLANNSIFNGIKTINHTEFMLINYPISSIIPRRLLSLFLNSYFPFSRISSVSDELIKYRLSPIFAKLLLSLKNQQLLPFQNYSFLSNIKKIENLKDTHFSYWTKYQSDSFSDFKPTKRFMKIGNILKELKLQSITDLASNQGFFARYLLDKRIAKHANCIDLDENAINDLYNSVKKSEYSITPCVQNIIFSSNKLGEKPINERFQADAVLALAITHHLILTQYISIKTIFQSIARFSNKYVLIEFMPLGLWNGKYAPPVPEWYNEQWFEQHFNNHFELLQKEKLEANRILFVGKLK